MTDLRSEGWRVRPRFVPHGPVAPITLIADDLGLTQLAGVYPVAWQTPWAELGSLGLVRRGSRMVLSATVAGRRYQWHRHGLEDYEALREIVVARGGVIAHASRRRVVVVVTAVAVLAASLSGVIGALWSARARLEHETARASAAAIANRDLPTGWSATPTGLLSFLMPPPGRVDPVTTTTSLAVDLVTPAVVARFQRCLGVSAATDRVFGGSAQLPDVQVTSPIFHRVVPFETELATVAQYYASSSMVRRDVAEMSRPGFGACFATANASLLLSNYTGQLTVAGRGQVWTPRTFEHGWARGGLVSLALPGVATPYALVVVVIAGGHDETTLTVLTPSWPADQALVTSLVGTLKARVGGRAAAA